MFWENKLKIIILIIVIYFIQHHDSSTFINEDRVQRLSLMLGVYISGIIGIIINQIVDRWNNQRKMAIYIMCTKMKDQITQRSLLLIRLQ